MTPSDAFWRKYRKPATGRTLIVGAKVYPNREDRRGLYTPPAIGVDMLEGPGVDIVANLEESDAVERCGQFDHIECRSVLEHSRRPWLLAENLQRMMKPGATLDLTVPFVWRLHQYPGDLFRFTAEGVRALFPAIQWDALMYATQDHLWKGEGKQPKLMVGRTVYLARTEVLGWGRLE